MHVQLLRQSAVDDDPVLDARIRELQRRAFPQTPALAERRHYRHLPRDGDQLVLAWSEATLAAEVALFWATARPAAGEALELRLVCLGNVCSDPDPALRGGGYAAACMTAALAAGRAGGADFALLFCREHLVAWYARFGFAAVDSELQLTRPGGSRWRRDHHDLRLAASLRAGLAWPEGELVLDVDDF